MTRGAPYLLRGAGGRRAVSLVTQLMKHKVGDLRGRFAERRPVFRRRRGVVTRPRRRRAPVAAAAAARWRHLLAADDVKDGVWRAHHLRVSRSTGQQKPRSTIVPTHMWKQNYRQRIDIWMRNNSHRARS